MDVAVVDNGNKEFKMDHEVTVQVDGSARGMHNKELEMSINGISGVG